MIHAVRLHPDPVLRRRCAPAGPITESLRDLARDLTESMYAARGRGLAAPQIGVLTRAFVVDVGWRDGPADPIVFLDPRVIAASRETATSVEMCLSLPGRPRCVLRPRWVLVEWTDPEGATRRRRFEGTWAVCVQHEADHLDGRLIIDHDEQPALPGEDAADEDPG